MKKKKNSYLLQILSTNLWFSGHELFFVIIFYFLYKDTIGKDMLFELQLQTRKIRNNEVLI